MRVAEIDGQFTGSPMRATLLALAMCETTEARAIPVPAGPASGRGAAPSTQGSIPKPHPLGREPLILEPWKGTLDLKVYAPNILLAEARCEVPSLFDDDVIELRDRVLARIRRRLTEQGGATLSGGPRSMPST
jgi:hypothetical protein